jgi:hypothetical protein
MKKIKGYQYRGGSGCGYEFGSFMGDGWGGGYGYGGGYGCGGGYGYGDGNGNGNGDGEGRYNGGNGWGIYPHCLVIR